jgi:hypothetical protein
MSRRNTYEILNPSGDKRFQEYHSCSCIKRLNQPNNLFANCKSLVFWLSKTIYSRHIPMLVVQQPSSWTDVTVTCTRVVERVFCFSAEQVQKP